MKWPKSVNTWDSSFLICTIVVRIKMKLCIWKGIINSKVTDMCKGMLLLLNYSRTCSGLWCDFVGALERILCSITFWPETSQFGSRDSLKIEVILELERTCGDLTTSFSRCGSCGQENRGVPKFTEIVKAPTPLSLFLTPVQCSFCHTLMLFSFPLRSTQARAFLQVGIPGQNEYIRWLMGWHRGWDALGILALPLTLCDFGQVALWKPILSFINQDCNSYFVPLLWGVSELERLRKVPVLW